MQKVGQDVANKGLINGTQERAEYGMIQHEIPSQAASYREEPCIPSRQETGSLALFRLVDDTNCCWDGFWRERPLCIGILICTEFLTI